MTPSRRRRSLTPGALLLVGCLGAACAAPVPPGAGAPLDRDTLTGLVLVTGADPFTRVELRTDAGSVTLEGPAADSLRSVARAEASVVGERRPDAFHVRSFRVVRVGGEPVTDGVLALDDGSAVVTTASGSRVRFGTAPAGLRALAGQRVWIAGPPGAPPASWGRITAPD